MDDTRYLYVSTLVHTKSLGKGHFFFLSLNFKRSYKEKSSCKYLPDTPSLRHSLRLTYLSVKQHFKPHEVIINVYIVSSNYTLSEDETIRLIFSKDVIIGTLCVFEREINNHILKSMFYEVKKIFFILKPARADRVRTLGS